MAAVTFLPGTDPRPALDARRAVDASGAKIDWDDRPDSLARTRVALKGPRGPRSHPDNAALRRSHDLFASIRHVATCDGVAAPLDFADFYLVRDNLRWDAAIEASAPALHARLARLAFEFGARNSRRRLTLLHEKDDALVAAATKVATDYPQFLFDAAPIATLDDRLVSGDLDLVLLPSRIADAVWERCIEAGGGASISPGLSLGQDVAVFESDPLERGGAGTAGLLLAAAMMLEHLKEGIPADRISRAVKAALAEGIPPDRIADDVIRRLSKR